MMPHTCHVERLFRGGFARVAGSPARTISDTLETQPATCLILAIISSTAFSAGHLSLAMRLMALAHTFSLLRMVNSNGSVPAENWLCTILRCGSEVQKSRAAPDFVTGYQRPSEPSTYGIRFSSRMKNWTNSLARFLFFAFSKITPTFTAERYCIGLPSGFAGKPEVAISSL